MLEGCIDRLAVWRAGWLAGEVAGWLAGKIDGWMRGWMVGTKWINKQMNGWDEWVNGTDGEIAEMIGIVAARDVRMNGWRMHCMDRHFGMWMDCLIGWLGGCLDGWDGLMNDWIDVRLV